VPKLLRDTDIDSIILKLISNMIRIAGTCEHGNETSVSLKGGEFIDQFD
jgi:hypothetical protein